MTIFEKLKNKANQALQSVGNFIDRDQSIPGVQLAQGGLGNRVSQTVQNIGNTNVGGYRLADQIKAYPQAFQQNLPFTPDRQENFNRNIEDILGERSKATTLAQGFNNWFSAPLMQVPYNVKETFGGEDKSTLSRIGHGAQAAFGLLPGVDDALFAGYNALKGAATERSKQGFQPGLAGNEYFGLGDAVTGGEDNFLTHGLNMAELPLLLMGGLKAKNLDEVLQSELKRVDELAPEFKSLDNILSKARGADELAQPIKTSKNTIFVTPEGTAIKPRVQPKTTASLERMLAQAEDVIPGGTKQADDTIGGLLTAGKNTEAPRLPANIDEGVTVTQKSGDNFFQGLRKSKDVNTFDKIRLSRQERLEKAMPKNVYAKIKANIVDPKNKLIAESVDWGKKYENVLENLPIKIGSKEDKLIRQFNSGAITADDLIGQVGEKKAAEIIGAHEQLRGMYDEMIQFINTRRGEQGLTQIPYKEDFLSQIGNKRSGNMLENLFFGKDNTTGEFSGGIFKKQGEAANDYGAIEGMMSYLDYAKRAGFTDLVTPKLDEYINLAQKAGADPSIVKYLDDYRNEILGVRDTGLGDQIAGATGKVRGAAVLGNVRSLVAQSYNLPQAIAEANPVNFVKGMFSKTARAAESQSPLLKSLSENTSSKLVKGYDKLTKPAVDALQTANNVTAKQVWRSFFEQGKAAGVDDAVQYADDLTVQLMGDRRLGELGQYYQSWFGKTFSPFTIENQAGMNKLIRNVGDKKFGTVLGTLAAWHIGNNLIEKFGTGDRPFLDPVDMLNDVYEQWYGSDKKEPDKVKAVARVVTELTNLVPVLQSPMFTGAKLALGDKTRDIFGTEDPTWMNALSLYDITDVGRNITGNKLIDVPWNLASKVTPYTNQLARTTQAAISQDRGYTESRKGNPMFETPDNLFDKGRALLFGQNSTQEARDMFDNEFDWGLKAKQNEVIQQIPSKEGKIEYLQNARKENIAKNQLESMLSGKGSTSFSGDSDSIGLAAFDGKKATSESIQERMDVYKGLNKIINDDTLPQEYKDAAIKASGADEKDVVYYNLAAKDVDVKLQEMLPVIDGMSNEDAFQYLAESRRVIGGKQLLTTTMIDYLYERDYISKGQKDALKALKYDEIKNEFYYKKSYKGGSGGKLSYKQALSLFKVDLPKYSSLKSMSSILSAYDQITSGSTQTARGGETLLTDILSGAPQTNSNKGLWNNT